MNLYPYTMGFTAITSFVLGFFVIYRNPRSMINLTWGLGCLSCGAWSLFFVVSLFSRSREEAIFYVRLLNLFAAFIPVFVAHFCKEITGIDQGKNWIVRFGYATAVLISLFAFTDYFCTVQSLTTLPYYSKDFGFMYRFFTVHFFFYALYGEFILWRYLKGPFSEKKNQIKYIFIGLTLGYAGGFAAFLPTYGLANTLFPMHFVWLYSVCVTYAILKHQLMDIRIVIEKTIMYSFFLIMTSVFYFLIVFVVYNLVVQNFSGDGNFILENTILYSLPPLLGSVLMFGLGLFVFLQNRKSPVNQLFALLCLVFFVWLASYAVVYSTLDESIAIVFARTACTAAACLAVVPYHFLVTLLGIKNEKKGIVPAYAATTIFLLGFIFTDFLLDGVYQYFWGYYSKAGFLHPLYLSIFYLIWLRCLTILIKFQSDNNNAASKRNQARYLLIAFLIVLLSSLDYLPKYGYEFYPAGFIFVVFFALIVAYAIVKHSLLDIRFVLKKTALYSMLLILVSAIYIAGIFLIYKAMLQGTNQPSNIIFKSLGLVFIIAILLKPLEIFLQRFLDKKFFKGTIVQIAQQKDRLQSEIERSERLKSVGVLAAGMAHEIKNPLTAIKTFAEHLPEKYNDPDFREKFKRIVTQEVARVTDIVTNLLLFSRPSEPVQSQCDMNKILKETLDLLSGEIVKARINVRTDLTHTAVSYVDPAQMKQAFLNILMNAIDAMKPGGGEILIKTQAAANYLIIEIRDTGPGICKDEIARIFDPFYTGKESGTGLGLTVTHAMIEKNNGKIAVESQPGAGTAFVIKLPLTAC